VTGRVVALLVTVASVVGYHVAQRSAASTLRAPALFGFVYTVAAISSLIAGHLTGVEASSPLFAARHWSTWLLTAAVLGIEFGVLAMYRTGWSLSTANITTQAITTIALVGLGKIAYSEAFTVSRAAGITLCAGGAWLINH